MVVYDLISPFNTQDSVKFTYALKSLKILPCASLLGVGNCDETRPLVFDMLAIDTPLTYR